MRIRYFALFAIVALLGAGLVYPVVAHALSALCAPGASGTSAPTPTPIPTPALVGTAVKGAALSSPQTYTGAQSGDLVLIASLGNVQFPATPNGLFLVYSGLNDGNSHFFNVWAEPVTAQIGTSIILPTLTGASTGVCIADYRFNPPYTDGVGTTATGTNTAPTGNSFTNTFNSALVWWAAGVSPTSGTVAAAVPAGYNADCNLSAVNGTNFGVVIASKINTTAGSIAGAAGTLSGGTQQDWIVGQFGFQPLNDIN